MMGLDVVQGCYFAPVMNALEASGAPSSTLLKHTAFDKFKVQNPGAVIPVPVMLDLFDEIARAEGSMELPDEIGSRYRLDGLPGWGDALLSSPDILRTLQLATSPHARVLSHNTVSARLDGPKAIFETSFPANPSNAQEWLAIMSFLLSLDGFRAGCGADWVPDEIDIASSNIDVLERLFDLSGVVVRTNQPSTRIHFKSREIINQMNPYHGGGPADIPLPETAQGKLLRILDSLEPMHRPTLEMTSAWFDLSPRTLQRSLAEEATNFSSVLQNWRVKKAVVLLEFSNLSIAEISEHLHYAHAPHFIRAFNSWFGTSPQKHRDLLADL